MHLELLVEESSAEAALHALIPKIAPGVTFAVRVFKGKPDLLRKLSDRLRGYAEWLPQDFGIVVLTDEDRRDCRKLKGQLEEAAWAAGMGTKSRSRSNRFQVLNRIAVEELEAWFFGDPDAVRAAYPRVPDGFEHKAAYRNPDGIAGGTAEALERLLQRAGYYRGGLQKIDTARAISRHMDPERNTSHSFCVFRDGLRAMLA